MSGKKQSDSIGTTSNSPKTCTRQNIVENSIFLESTDINEITQIVSNLKNKSSSGHDNITIKMLKQFIHGIASPISTLINRSLSEGVFQRALKLAKIIPVYKKDDHEQLGNYTH